MAAARILLPPGGREGAARFTGRHGLDAPRRRRIRGRGRAAHPLGGIIADGSIDDIFGGILIVGQDQVFNRGVISPTLAVARTTVGGT